MDKLNLIELLFKLSAKFNSNDRRVTLSINDYAEILITVPGIMPLILCKEDLSKTTDELFAAISNSVK